MNIYEYSVRKPDGSMFALDQYKGKVLLIVNTASNCGYTKQLMGLEKLYQKYKDSGFEVLAFPANQFRNQEPDTIEVIEKNYKDKYGVTFPIFDKIEVNGENQSPLYTYLKDAQPFDPNSETPLVMIPIYKSENKNYKDSSDIKWNFTKFLIDKNGSAIKRFEPEVTPSHLDEDISALLR